MLTTTETTITATTVVIMQSVKKILLTFERQSNQDKTNRDQT